MDSRPRRALVTGGAGFIGSHLVDALLAEGCAVDVVDNLTTGTRENLHPALSGGARLHVADVSDAAAVIDLALRLRPDVIFHLAAQIDVRRSVTQPAFDATTNVVGTAAVLEAARLAGTRRVVLASTAAVYGNPRRLPIAESEPTVPQSPYGASKVAAEAYALLYRDLHELSTLTLRLANVYGPRQGAGGETGAIAIFCRNAAAGRRATVFGAGTQTRDFIYVGDVVSAFVAAARADVTGTLNVCGGRETSVLRVAEVLGVEVEHLPERPGEIARSCLDPRAALAALGWSAQISLDEGLRRTLEATISSVSQPAAA
jgi:UDP-glucose 4-epimerase